MDTLIYYIYESQTQKHQRCIFKKKKIYLKKSVRSPINSLSKACH